MKLIPPFKEQLSIDYENNFEKLANRMNFLSDEDCKIAITYLTSCTLVDEWLSAIPDPLDNSIKVRNRSWTDGDYFWDEMLIHFVRHYKVRLPNDFLSHIKQQYEKERPELDMDSVRIEISQTLRRARKGDLSVYDMS